MRLSIQFNRYYSKLPLSILFLFLFNYKSLAQNPPRCLPDLLHLHMSGAGGGQKTGNPAYNEQITYQTNGSFDIVARDPVLTADGFWTWRLDSLHGMFWFSADASRVISNFTQTAHWDMNIIEITVSNPFGLGWVKYNPLTGEIDSLRATWGSLSGTSTDLDGVRWSARGGGRFVPLVNLPSPWANLEGLFPVDGDLVLPGDTEPPKAICDNHIVWLDANGNAEITVADIGAQSTDNCTIADIWVVPTHFGCADAGAWKKVYLTVTDSAGNSSSCDAYVQVLDTVRPEVSCPDITVTLDASGTVVLDESNVIVNGMDACGPVSFYDAEPATLGCADVGYKWVSVWAADPSFNLTHCWVWTTVKSEAVPELEFTAHNRFFDPKSLIKCTPGTDLSDKFVKICADGSARASRIALRGCPDLEKLKVRIKEDPEEKNTGVYGRFVPEPSSGAGERFFWYEHPECWEGADNNANSSFKQLHFEVIDADGGSPLIELPVRLFRAPVLMVHGVWADGAGTFGAMQTALSQGQNQLPSFYPGPLTKVVDYKATNAAAFSENKYVVLTWLRNFLFELTYQEGFSVGRVAAVGHSMGGLLSRIFLQSNDYHDDFIKLITVNTPHSGTQTANWLMSHYGPVRKAFDLSGRNTSSGAVRDLQMDSDALWGVNGLNSPWELNWNVVPSHAIVTYATQPETDIAAFLLLKIIQFESDGKSAFDFLTEDIFNNQYHDLIVPINSQTGGLHAPQVSVFNQQWHSSTANPQVINRVKELLEKCPDAPEFAQDGFDPETLEYDYILPWIYTPGDGDPNVPSPVGEGVFGTEESLNSAVAGFGSGQGALFPGDAWIKIAPNPFATETVLHFFLQNTADIEVEITDLTGRTVDRILCMERVTGEHQLIWMPDGTLPAGLYTARLIVNGQPAGVKKLAFVR